MIESKETASLLLNLLDEALELERSAPIEMLVCGGTALLLIGLSNRVTEDIDVLAFVENGLDIQASPFPDTLQRAVERVARDRQLPLDWINPGPASIQEWGLPAGCLEHATTQVYGKYLTVRFIDRKSQIHLKVYAAVDQGPGKHLQDLQKLQPQAEEIMQAALWCLQHDSSPAFRSELQLLLIDQGFPDVAERV